MGIESLVPDTVGEQAEVEITGEILPSNIPIHLSIVIPGLNVQDKEKFGDEVRHGKIGKAIVDFREKGLNVAIKINSGKVDFWVSKHRPLVAASVATVLTATTAGGVILFRKSRQKRLKEKTVNLD